MMLVSPILPYNGDLTVIGLLPQHVSPYNSLVGTMQLPDDVHRVSSDCLAIQVPVPLPVGCRAVQEGQQAMPI